ncbi:MAG TPA: hypothetical protein VKT19_00730 [Steroidobacteraceae bacterium]|nr:hypothetical protein [Steroidobacteraceae bacterium]
MATECPAQRTEAISAAAARFEIQNSQPTAERANYNNVGFEQKLLDCNLTLGADSCYERAIHLVDEGQFGAPSALTRSTTASAASRAWSSRPITTSADSLMMRCTIHAILPAGPVCAPRAFDPQSGPRHSAPLS